MSQATWDRLRSGEVAWLGRRVVLAPGEVLFEADEGCRHFFALLEVGYPDYGGSSYTAASNKQGHFDHSLHAQVPPRSGACAAAR